MNHLTNTETTVFVYDAGGKLAAEYSTATPLAIPTTNYLTTDHLGSPRVVTDKQGNVTARRDFMPFGEEIGVGVGTRTESLKYSFTGTDNIRKRFTGYEKDDETQLDFAEARMYQNKHGRFTAIDPLLASASLLNPQTFNRYTYTGNNPINYTDPSGLLYYKNDETGLFKWFDEDPGEGWEDITDQEEPVTTPGAIDGVYLNKGDLVTFGDTRGSIEIVRAGTEEPLAETASDAVLATEATATEATAGDHAISAFMTWAENNGGSFAYAVGVQPFNNHTETGQFIGNVATVSQGIAEVIGGFATAAGAGAVTIVASPLCLTGVGCAVPAVTGTVTAAGLLTATHGVAVIGNTIYNMSANQGSSSRSGSSGEISGKNPPVHQPKQAQHASGAGKGKSEFYAGENVDGLVKSAWEYGKPYFDKNGKIRGKKFTFDRPVGTRNGQPTNTVDVRFSKKHGIHGFPGRK